MRTLLMLVLLAGCDATVGRTVFPNLLDLSLDAESIKTVGVAGHVRVLESGDVGLSNDVGPNYEKRGGRPKVGAALNAVNPVGGTGPGEGESRQIIRNGEPESGQRIRRVGVGKPLLEIVVAITIGV